MTTGTKFLAHLLFGLLALGLSSPGLQPAFADDSPASTSSTEAATDQLSLADIPSSPGRKDEQANIQEILNGIKSGTFQIPMISVPTGRFNMGCLSKKGCMANEVPARFLKINAFQLSKTEITFALWDACVADGGCSHKPDDEGWGRGELPVFNVSFDDINNEFIPWLNRVTGKSYRLPSESEWEYAARSGAETKFSWGDHIDCKKASYDGGADSDCYQKLKDGKLRGPAAVGSYPANTFGLYDMHGNVWEWTQDCWTDDYKRAPRGNKPQTRGDCSARVLRGGSWGDLPESLRAATRGGSTTSYRFNFVGFRLSQDS